MGKTTKIRPRLLGKKKSFSVLVPALLKSRVIFCFCNWLCFRTFSVHQIILLWRSSTHPRHSVQHCCQHIPTNKWESSKSLTYIFVNMSRCIMLLWKLQEYLEIIVGELDLLVTTRKYTHEP